MVHAYAPHYLNKGSKLHVTFFSVESVLKLHPIIENICVCARPSESFCVALVVPSVTRLLQFAEESFNKTGFTADELAKDKCILDAIIRVVLTFGHSKGLEKFEVPKKMALVLDKWTPDSGLVTAAMKLRRKQVEEKYAEAINRLYSDF